MLNRGSLVMAALLALIGVVQAGLWFGRGSLPHVMELRAKLRDQQTANAAARERNARLQAEVSDLKEGLEMVEEKARSDLGMVRANEIFIQVTANAPAASAAPAAPRQP